MSLTPFFFNLDDQVDLEFIVRNRDGTPYDLSTATVDLLVTGVGEFPCVVTTALEGEVTRTVDVGDFSVAGAYRSQLRVTDGTLIYHTDVFNIQIGEVVDTSIGSVPTPPAGAGTPAEGAIPFGDIGGGSYTTDATNLFWDDTRNLFKLFGGTAGSTIAKGIVLGLGTAPTTSPTDSVQIWAQNNVLATNGTAGLWMRGEAGGRLYFGDSGFAETQLRLWDTAFASSVKIVVSASSAIFGSDEDISFIFGTAGTERLQMLTGGNIVMGVDATVGTTAAGVLYIDQGTAPTTSPTDKFALYAADIAGATTSGANFRDETGHVHTIGRTVNAQAGDSTSTTPLCGTLGVNVTAVGTPANTTETILHTLTIPANALSVNGQGVRYWFTGTLAANGNNKTIQLKKNGTGGAVVVDSGTIATNNADWRIEGRLIRTAANTVVHEAACIVGPAGAASGAVSVHRFNGTDAAAMTLTSANTLDLTGLNGTASANDIRCIGSKLIFEPF